MSYQHFFLKDQILSSEIETSGNSSFALNLSDEDLRHVKVLRLKGGEHIGVVDGAGVFYECEVMDASKTLKVRNATKKSPQAENIHLWLCPGLSKGNKLDDVIRGATEIGIYGFIPTIFDRSVVKLDEKKELNKIDRLKKIAKSASMQSGQYRLPSIQNFVEVDTLCKTLADFDAVFVCWEEEQSTKNLSDACLKLKASKDEINVAIIVGPEGGITNEEVQAFKNCNKNCYVVSIGSSILRTETASIAASSIIKFLLAC